MKTLLVLFGVAVIAAAAYLYYQGRVSQRGAPPGVADGKLQRCPGKPNCVCSESGADADHAIAPLTLTSDGEPIQTLKDAIIAVGGDVTEASGDYLAATFTSGLFGFVDDLELRIDRESQAQDGLVVHVRSSSRVGQSDLGVNRKRVEALRAHLR